MTNVDASNIDLRSRMRVVKRRPITQPIIRRPLDTMFLAQPKTTQVVKPKALPHAVLPAKPRLHKSSVLMRQQLPKISKPKHRVRVSKPKALLWSMAAVIFLAGLGVSLMSLKTNRVAVAQVAALTKNSDDKPGDSPVAELPSETPPSNNINNYQVAPDLPRFISIPKFNVKARVLGLGVKDDNQLKAPTNIFDAGWYQGSAKPGENGAVLIDGHVSGPTQKGVFYNLKNLKSGDEIQITRGDGVVIKYKVAKSQTYKADETDMVAALRPVEGTKGLNLITCGGKFNSKTNTFEDRVVVFTTQIN